MKVFKQCPALPISSSEGSGFSTTTEDQIFPSLPANDTAEINPIKKSQQPFSNLTTTKDLLSRLPSMMSPFNLQ
jgi:hypothetical protein